MLWKDVLALWEKGVFMQYPKQLKHRFQWNTSVLKNDGNVEFKQVFRSNDQLPSTQNKKDFLEPIQASSHPYVCAFPNRNKDTMLVVPMPVRGKNYATLRDFLDNASEIQQHHFWKKVAQVSKQFMKEKGKVWISVHGLGVAYTHVRISSSPKYYFDQELAKA
jgi:hypothetical protein